MERAEPRLYVTPNNNDVLCGRGIKNFKHPGNQMLRHKIVAELDKYLLCVRRSEKSAIIRGVAEYTLQQGGRFLKYDYHERSWYDGGMAAAKMRVGVAFRDARSPTKARFIENLKRDAAAAEALPATNTTETSTSGEDDDQKIRSNEPSSVPLSHASISILPTADNNSTNIHSITTQQDMVATQQPHSYLSETLLPQQHVHGMREFSTGSTQRNRSLLSAMYQQQHTSQISALVGENAVFRRFQTRPRNDDNHRNDVSSEEQVQKVGILLAAANSVYALSSSSSSCLDEDTQDEIRGNVTSSKEGVPSRRSSTSSASRDSIFSEGCLDDIQWIDDCSWEALIAGDHEMSIILTNSSSLYNDG